MRRRWTAVLGEGHAVKVHVVVRCGLVLLTVRGGVAVVGGVHALVGAALNGVVVDAVTVGVGHRQASRGVWPAGIGLRTQHLKVIGNAIAVRVVAVRIAAEVELLKVVKAVAVRIQFSLDEVSGRAATGSVEVVFDLPSVQQAVVVRVGAVVQAVPVLGPRRVIDRS